MKLLRALFFVLAFAAPVALAQYRIAVDRVIGNALDVRWAGPASVFVARSRRGVFRLSLDGKTAPRLVVGGERAKKGFFNSARLGVGDEYMVDGSQFGALAGKKLGAGVGIAGIVPFAVTMDLDAKGDDVAVLGARRGEKGKWAPEGGVVWFGHLSQALHDLHAVRKSASAAARVGRCHFMELGAVRFLLDGSFVVIPGVEPGMYQYSADGRLIRAWSTRKLGFQDDCDLDRQESALFARDVHARNEWLSSRVTLDDLIPMGKGHIGLILRHPTKSSVTWSLVIFDLAKNTTKTVLLPLRATSAHSHVRADARGGRRIAVVMFEWEQAIRGKAPPKSHLIVLEEK